MSTNDNSTVQEDVAKLYTQLGVLTERLGNFISLVQEQTKKVDKIGEVLNDIRLDMQKSQNLAADFERFKADTEKKFLDHENKIQEKVSNKFVSNTWLFICNLLLMAVQAIAILKSFNIVH